MDSSSIYPFFLTFLIIQVPSIYITYRVIFLSLCPQITASIMVLLQVITACALFSCVYTDPGIIPQIVDKYEWDEDHSLIPAVDHRNLQDHKYLIVTNSLYIHQKYCVECCIYRPLRAIHCHVCNHCVEMYDHHCPWLGICIGKFNYKYFFIFITSSLALSITIIAISLTIILTNVPSNPFYQFILQFIILGASTAFFTILFKLFTYHLFLFHNRSTTNQDLKKIYKILRNTIPFERCKSHNRKPLAPINSKLLMNFRHNLEMKSQKSNSADITAVNNSKRFSFLIQEKDTKRQLLQSPQL